MQINQEEWDGGKKELESLNIKWVALKDSCLIDIYWSTAVVRLWETWMVSLGFGGESPA